MSIKSRNRDTTPLPENHRRTLRRYAAVLAGMVAVMYFLIGFHVVTVIEGNTDQRWGLFAAAAYVLGVVLLLLVDLRLVWTLGILLQVFVIITYFGMATQRSPAFEIWGVVIRMCQLMIVVVLAYLIFHVPAENGNNRALAIDKNAEET